MRMLYEIFCYIQRAGVVEFESDVEDPRGSRIFANHPDFLKDPLTCAFVCDSLRMLVVGVTTANELDQLMELDIEVQRRGRQEPVNVAACGGGRAAGAGDCGGGARGRDHHAGHRRRARSGGPEGRGGAGGHVPGDPALLRSGGAGGGAAAKRWGRRRRSCCTCCGLRLWLSRAERRRFWRWSTRGARSRWNCDRRSWIWRSRSSATPRFRRCLMRTSRRRPMPKLSLPEDRGAAGADPLRGRHRAIARAAARGRWPTPIS